MLKFSLSMKTFLITTFILNHHFCFRCRIFEALEVWSVSLHTDLLTHGQSALCSSPVLHSWWGWLTVAAKGAGLTNPGDWSDGGAADASADMGDHGTEPTGEQHDSAKQCDCRARGDPTAFYLMLQNLFCSLPAWYRHGKSPGHICPLLKYRCAMESSCFL